LSLIAKIAAFGRVFLEFGHLVLLPNCLGGGQACGGQDVELLAFLVVEPVHLAFTLDHGEHLERLRVLDHDHLTGAGVDELAGQVEASVQRDIRVLTFDGAGIEMTPGVKFPNTIAHNVIPMAGDLIDDERLETVEEKKLRDESRKILEIPGLLVAATCVRVPVFTGHSLSITASFDRPISPQEATEILSNAPGVVVHEMPTPRLAAGKDPSYVGRIRPAETVKNGLSFFVSNDNLRKGAALNTVQIAEELISIIS